MGPRKPPRKTSDQQEQKHLGNKKQPTDANQSGTTGDKDKGLGKMKQMSERNVALSHLSSSACTNKLSPHPSAEDERRQYTPEIRNHWSSIANSSERVTLEFCVNKIKQSIQTGELLGESMNGSTVYTGMELTSGSLVAIFEWHFQLEESTKEKLGGSARVVANQGAINNQLFALKSTIGRLQKLKHCNIIPCIGLHIIRDGSGSMFLYLAQQKHSGDEVTIIKIASLQQFMTPKGVQEQCGSAAPRFFSTNKKFIRGTTLQSLLQLGIPVPAAIVQLWARGILRALEYLHSNHVFYDRLRGTSVFMNTFGEIKVGDYGFERMISEICQNVTGAPAFSIEESIGRENRNDDIYDFGVLILSLLKGQDMTKCPHNIPSSIPADMQNFLQKCLATSKHEKWTATQLLEHSFVKMQLLKEPNSRLQQEFEDFQFLGSGANGQVFKARKKIEQQFYALKSIKIDSKDNELNKCKEEEVVLLSQLTHKHVVRYYSSWIGTAEDELFESQSGSDFSETSSSSYISGSTHTESTNAQTDADVVIDHQYMYIQMEFCDSTLRDAIDGGLYNSYTKVIRIFREILMGLKFIHQKNIIHRDLKPNNIFLDCNGKVKIGDFGLAKRLMPKAAGYTTFQVFRPGVPHPKNVGIISDDVGTDFYVAPELDSIETTTIVHNQMQKVDMYSMGIVLFEMCYRFGTEMERQDVITGLRHKKVIFPEGFSKMQLPDNIPGILKWLLQHDPKNRPIASTILETFDKFLQVYKKVGNVLPSEYFQAAD